MKNLVVLLLLTASAFAQGGVYAGPTVVNGVGQPIANASVYIVLGNPCGVSPTYSFCGGQAQGIYTGPVPPSSLAILYKDVTLGTTITNPVVTDPLGNWTVYTNPGLYWAVITGYQIVPTVQPVVVGNGQGGSGSVNCATALNGSMAAYLSPTSLGCDPNMGTDFHGNGFSQSWKYLGPVNGFFGVIGGATDPGTVPAYKLNANEVRALAPLTAPTPYYWRWPSTPCAVGQVWNVTGTTTDANGDTVTTYGCLTPGASVSITATSPIVVTPSPITGTGVISCPTCGSATYPTAGNPSTPTVTPTGTPGATNYSYVIVGNQDCAAPTSFHSAQSSTGSTSTGNATLTSSNYNLLTGYGDTLYGYRGFDIYRKVGGATQGKLATCVGKEYRDIGASGDGSTAPSTNTSQLDPLGLMRPSPLGCPSIPKSPDGVDAPPCTPNAFDDEFTAGTGNTPASSADGVWQWGNQTVGGTASWTGGMLAISTGVTTSADYIVNTTALPTAPYTYIAWMNQIVFSSNSTGSHCFVGFRESSTGKMATIGLGNNQASGTTAGQSGTYWAVDNWTSNSAFTVPFFQPYQPAAAYLKIQNDGSGHVVYSFSNDGVIYSQFFSQNLTVPFTTAPNQLIVGGVGGAGTSVKCDFDFLRRTQ